MWRNRRCCCRPQRCKGIGVILISVGAGILLGYIIPYYLLIFLFGCVLIFLGIRAILKK